MSLLVTGAGGGLGRRVVERLLALDAPHVIATTRDPSALADLAARGVEVRRADFDDPGTLPAAFAGAERALIISTDATAVPGTRVRQHGAAIDAAARAGVGHLLYTSLVDPAASNPAAVAPDHRATEDLLQRSGTSWTSLRNNLYAEIGQLALPAAIASGRLYAAAGDGAVSYVTRDDCARAAAGALLADALPEGPIDITGPVAYDRAEIAAIAAEVSGRRVEYVPVDAEEAVAGLVAAGVPEPAAAFAVSFDEAAATGKLAVVSSSVADLSGQAPESFAAFLHARRDQLVAAA